MASLPPFPPQFLRNRWVRLKSGFLGDYRALIKRMDIKRFKESLRSRNTAPIRWQELRIDLERSSDFIHSGFIFISILIIALLILQIAQLPFPNLQTIPAKGVTLYSAHEAQQAHALFGSKPIELDAIQLRGVIITGKTTDGKDTGFVLLEIDGKATGPVGLGEIAGKGMVVHAIHSDGATLTYQGQKIDLTLSKTSTKKTPATVKPNASLAPAINSNSNTPITATNEAGKPAL